MPYLIFNDFHKLPSNHYSVVCSQPIYPGPCKGNIQRHYFDVKAGMCLPFYYGGCGANHNNFDTGDECRMQCDPPCEPVKCDMELCRYGFKKNNRGCLTCECKDPCAVGVTTTTFTL